MQYSRPDFRLEREAIGRGFNPVVGCDEAGRGAIAGPIVAAAVILDPYRIPHGIDDSKRLSPRKRDKLAAAIRETSTVAIAVSNVRQVDAINVLQASLWAMNKAVQGLGVTPGAVLIDGPYPIENDAPCYAVIRGDQTSLSIAAASIIAKTARDQIMRELAHRFPLYNFEIHKGYGTSRHIEQLKRYGPCSEHRYSCGLVFDAARLIDRKYRANDCRLVAISGRER